MDNSLKKKSLNFSLNPLLARSFGPFPVLLLPRKNKFFNPDHISIYGPGHPTFIPYSSVHLIRVCSKLTNKHKFLPQINVGMVINFN